MSCLSLLRVFILVFWGCGKAQRKAKQCAEGSGEGSGSTVSTASTAACPYDRIPQWLSVWTVWKINLYKLSWAACNQRKLHQYPIHGMKDGIGGQCLYWTFWYFLVFVAMQTLNHFDLYSRSSFMAAHPLLAIYGCWGHWAWFGAAKNTAARSVAIASIKTSRSGTSAASSATFTVPSLLQWPLGCTSEMLGACLESLLLNEN